MTQLLHTVANFASKLWKFSARALKAPGVYVARHFPAPAVSTPARRRRGIWIAILLHVFRLRGHSLLSTHCKRNSEHLPRLQPLKLGGVGTASFNLLPSGNGQSHHLCQEPRLKALRRDCSVHRKPNGQQDEAEGSRHCERTACHQPHRRGVRQLPLTPQRNSDAQQKYVHQQVDVHLVFCQGNKISDVFTPELCLVNTKVLHRELLAPPQDAIVEEVLSVVFESLLCC
mmetsp:Transcript_51877/g.97045  ORF Transcript_51877/g.97045 Transcript_51877/m.97045 type:complete len:229 (-) Transcript_51877:217-903(-)